MRITYEEYFSLRNRKALPDNKKREHSLSSCVACSRNRTDLQKAFPGRPVYEAPTYLNIDLPENVSLSKKRKTRGKGSFGGAK